MIRRPEDRNVNGAKIPKELSPHEEQRVSLVIGRSTAIFIFSAISTDIVRLVDVLRTSSRSATDTWKAYKVTRSIDTQVSKGIRETLARETDTEDGPSKIGIDLSTNEIDYLNGLFFGRLHQGRLRINDKRNNPEVLTSILQDLNSAWIKAGGTPRRGFERFSGG